MLIAGQERKIDIILPNRIGDSIMSLPSILCLKQLLESSNPDNYPKVTLFSSNDLTDVFQALNIFEVKRMSLKAKMKSWFKPADLAFFLYTSSKNMMNAGFQMLPEQKIYQVIWLINIECVCRISPSRT